MRCSLLLISALFGAGMAAAEPLSVAKGQWTVTTETYFTGTAEGEPVDIPPEMSVESACWSLDEEVQFDANTLMQALQGCTSTGDWATSYSLDLDLKCDFDGLPMTGPAQLARSDGGQSYFARIRLNTDAPDMDVAADMIMIGHRTGACAP